MKVRHLYLHSFEIAIFRLFYILCFIKFGVIAGELCQLSKCNWKIKKRRCVEFTIYLNVPKNKLEVHIYSTWPPFLSSHKFLLCLISKKTLLLPEFPLFRFKLYGVILPFNACSRYLLTLRQTLDEDYVLEKLFEIVLTLQQRFLFRNTFQQ